MVSPVGISDSTLIARDNDDTTKEASLTYQEIISLFNHAQELKRAEQYHDARALHERVINLSQ